MCRPVRYVRQSSSLILTLAVPPPCRAETPRTYMASVVRGPSFLPLSTDISIPRKTYVGCRTQLRTSSIR